MKRCTTTRWAIHEIGTGKFGYLYESEEEACKHLESLKSDSHAIQAHAKDRYVVVKVDLAWIEG